MSSGVCGTYSCGQVCNRVCGLEPKSEVGAQESDQRSPRRRSPSKPQVPPKPAHLQSPLQAGVHRSLSPATGELLIQPVKGRQELHSPNGELQEANGQVNVSHLSPIQNRLGSPSPVRGAGNGLSISVSGAHISPARNSRGIPKLASSPFLGFPSPGKRCNQSCKLLGEGGYSPAKLSPTNHSPPWGKLRTPSPVKGRMGSYSPSRTSKSWLGLNKIPGSVKKEKDKRPEKSISVPDLIVYLAESSTFNEKPERSPLKPLPSANCSGSAISRQTNSHKLSHFSNESVPHQINNCKEHSSGLNNGMKLQRECDVLNGSGVGEKGEEGETPMVFDSHLTCLRNEAIPPECERIEGDCQDEEAVDERSETEGEPKDVDNTERKLYNIACELLQTERAYVARLHLLDQVFCLRLTEEACQGSFPPEVVKNIFSNTSSIYSFHSQFLLPDLENCVGSWYKKPGLGTVLLQHAPFLRMYADYVRNFDQAMELVRTWTERSSAFKSIVQDVQSLEVCGNLTLQHHMLEPVQRVPRYEMLLKDYLKRLPKDNAEYKLAHKTLETISMAATHSNSAVHKAESLKRLLEIYEMVGEEEVVNPTNEFLREGRLLKLAARNTSCMERQLFLFNNFLLCCTTKFSLVGQRFTVRARIGVEGMQVQQTRNEDHLYTFQVSGKEKTLELQASSEQDRYEWIKVIQEAIDVFQKKNETFKLASKEPNVDDPTEELGRRAPRWIRDNEVTECMKCQEPFNALTRRRHHCRACGCVVCWKCSDNKVTLEYDGNKLNKVCKACYFILTSRQRGERADGKKRKIFEWDSSLLSRDAVISGFLQYSGSPKTWQPVWCVILRTEPPVLHLCTSPEDVKPVSSIPLLGSSVEDSAVDLEVHGQACFSLTQSSSAHTFSCDSPDLKQRWLAVLRVTATGKMPVCLPTDPHISTEPGAGVNGGTTGEELAVENGS
ncbi:FYVE, RhoGEF and PH domain-containing protein 4-like [Genypterus blacodes]|uniref:FYVE, RhoGEF and PH domain-containing protein 4-like n=1 Tax=Genypterus blacodes TaxID=154954 RepID=UPI003F762F1F